MIYTSLGGLDEIGKNAHVFDFDNNIIIVNFGSRYANKDEPGFDGVICDIKYLIQKKDSIKAIFFTNSLDGQLNISTLFRIRKNLPDIPIYMSSLTYRILFALAPNAIVIESKYKNNQIRTFDPSDNPIVISPNLKVYAYQVPSSIPGNCSLVLEWNEKEKVFIGGDFVNDSSPLWHKNFFSSFNKIAKHNINLFLCDSYNCDPKNNGITNYKILPHLERAIENSAVNRIFCPFYLKNLSYLSELVKYCATNSYKIAFLTKHYYDLAHILVDEGLIEQADQDVFTTNITVEGSQKLFVLIIERTDQLFPTLRRLFCSEKRQKFNESSDLYVPLFTPKPGFELDHVNIINYLIAHNINVYQNKIIGVVDCHPSEEQILKLIGLLAPNYALPFNGYFVNMKHFCKITENLFPTIKPFLVTNGDLIMFDFVKNSANILPHRLPANEMFLFGNTVSTNSHEDQIILQERQIIGNNGVVTVSFLIDPKKWKILSRVLIHSVGILLQTNNGSNIANQLVDEIQTIFTSQQPPHCSIAILKKEIYKNCPDIIWNSLGKSPKLIVTIVNKLTH